MLATMNHKKDKKPSQSEKESGKRIAYSHRWNPDILQAVENYRQAQEVAPSQIAVLEKAAIEFLKARGFWPLPEGQ